MSDQPAIRVALLHVRYGDFEALKGISFDVPRGTLFVLLGPNGGGNTTTFRVLSTLLRPSGGTASVGGCDVATDPSGVRKTLGVVFQSPSLDKVLTVAENLRCQGALYGLRGADLEGRISRALERLGLADRATARVATLSGGLKRRVEIAKGILHDPQILLLDEPTTGLDPGARRDVWTYLAELRDRTGVTCVVTTHLMEEAERCDRLVILHSGQIVAEGTPEELRSSIGGDVVSVETRDPASLAARVSERFSVAATVSDGGVRFECRDGHRLIPQLVDAFPGEVTAVRLGKPTLEDVFLKRTGHRFFDENLAGTPAEKPKGRRR